MGASESDSATSAQADRSNLDRVSSREEQIMIGCSVSIHPTNLHAILRWGSNAASFSWCITDTVLSVAVAVYEATAVSALLIWHCTCGPLLTAVQCAVCGMYSSARLHNRHVLRYLEAACLVESKYASDVDDTPWHIVLNTVT